MIVKTKKYQLETGTYIKFAMVNILKEQWWIGLIALAIISLTFFIPTWWFFIGTVIAFLLYLLFWLIQFAGVTQLEQNKVLFQKLSYEIDSRQILIKVNPKQGMPMTWDNIKKAKIGKDYFLFIVSKAQLIHLPFKIFNTDNERKFVETIIRRKGYIKDKSINDNNAKQKNIKQGKLK